MTFDDKITLIKKSEQMFDEYGNVIKADDIYKDILCNVSSVTRNEFYNASIVDYKPQLVVTINDFEYEGEEVAIFKSRKYLIIRTYKEKNGLLELTLGDKLGAIER